MKYDNSSVRRQDRLLDEQEALRLLTNNDYGVLSMVSGDNKGGYGIPIGYVWDGENSIYFHGANIGEKVNCLRNNNNVSFCIVGKSKVMVNEFTNDYESIILKGTIHEVTAQEEFAKALDLILAKYSPIDRVTARQRIKESMSLLMIVRMDVESFSGKTSRSVC